MNSNELTLFKEMIREIVRNVINEEVPKIIKEQSKKDYSKDLKEIKLLVAQSIKEGRKLKASGGRAPLREETKEGLSGLLAKRKPISVPRSAHPLVHQMNQQALPPAVKNILTETAMNMTGDDIAQMNSVPDEHGRYNPGSSMVEEINESYDVTEEFAADAAIPDVYEIDEEYESSVPSYSMGDVFKRAQEMANGG